MKKYNIGIVGAGRMGITHIAILGPNPDCQIIAISEPSKLIGSIFNKYFNELRIYKDYNEMINNEKLDGLIVCTPPNYHKEICKTAIENDINLFVEKPFTTSFIDALEISEGCEKSKIIGQAGYVNRFNDMFIKAKEFVKTKVIGDVIRFKSEMFSNTISKPDDGEGWRGNTETGGGCLFEMGSHAIDLVNFIIGVPEKVTGSVMNRIYSKNVEDMVSTTFIYKNGITGTLFINWSDPSFRKPSNKIEIIGTEGKILVSQHELKVFLKNDNKLLQLRKGWNVIYITDIFKNTPFYVRGNEFTNQLFHFIDNISGKIQHNYCSFRDATETQRIIDLIRKDSYSIRGGKIGEN